MPNPSEIQRAHEELVRMIGGTEDYPMGEVTRRLEKINQDKWDEACAKHEAGDYSGPPLELQTELKLLRMQIATLLQAIANIDGDYDEDEDQDPGVSK